MIHARNVPNWLALYGSTRFYNNPLDHPVAAPLLSFQNSFPKLSFVEARCASWRNQCCVWFSWFLLFSLWIWRDAALTTGYMWRWHLYVHFGHWQSRRCGRLVDLVFRTKNSLLFFRCDILKLLKRITSTQEVLVMIYGSCRINQTQARGCTRIGIRKLKLVNHRQVRLRFRVHYMLRWAARLQVQKQILPPTIY